VSAEMVSPAKGQNVARVGIPPSIVERSAVAVLLIAQFMANMDTAIANLATPSIAATLHTGAVGQQWVVAAYTLTSAMFMITAARVSTVFGDRSVFLGGLVVFTLSSLACGVAPNIEVLVAARGIQGIGAAMMVGQVLSGIRFRLHGAALTRAVSAYTVALSLSSVVGQVAGGAIVTANFFGSSWRPLFLINVPIGVGLLVVALWRMDNRGKDVRTGTFDVWGALLLGFAMLFCVVPLSIGYTMRWPPWAIVSLILSAACVAVLVRRERRVSAEGGLPLIDLRLFSVRGAAAGISAMALTRMVYFSLIFVMALYLQDGLHESALESGLSLMTWVVAYGVSGMLYSLVPARFVNIVPAAGCVVIAAAFGGLATLHDAGVAFVTILGFAGLAFGLLSTALVNRLTENAPEELSANLSGVLSTTVPLTATIGVAIFGSIYFMQTAAGGPDAANRSFAYVCVLFGVAFVLAAAASQAAMREATR
jgi:MFS family permease